MIETLEENFAKSQNLRKRKAVKKCTGWMEDFTTGDKIIFDYTPEDGTILSKAKKEPFGKILKAVYNLSWTAPASSNLKEALLSQLKPQTTTRHHFESG